MITRRAVLPVYIALCLLLGGASAAGFVANMLLQLMALPLIGWSLWSMRRDPPAGSVKVVLYFAAALIALFLIQLMPLPPELWSRLPGRAWVARDYALLHLSPPWLPLTLAPDRAVASMLWLLPALAVLLVVTVLGAFSARWFAWTVVSVTSLGVALGALQVVDGDYLYSITNYGVATGFFANANHMATLLLICIPFVTALKVDLRRRAKSRRNASAGTVVIIAAFVVIALGLLTNLSLAGLGLCVPVALTSYLTLARGDKPGRTWVAVVAGLVSVAAIAVIIIGPFGNNLVGEQSTNVELSRQVSFARTLHAAADYFPAGSGVGSFLAVYKTQEPAYEVTRTFMNHAHSDWIEMLLETGVPGVMLAAAFLFWCARRARAIWRADEPDLFGRAAVIATATILAHSLVDYPLRTAAISGLFAACIGLMTGVRPAVPRRRSHSSSSSRHISI